MVAAAAVVVTAVAVAVYHGHARGSGCRFGSGMVGRLMCENCEAKFTRNMEHNIANSICEIFSGQYFFITYSNESVSCCIHGR